MTIEPSNNIIVTTISAEYITNNHYYLNLVFPIDITKIPLSTQNIYENDINELPNASQIENNDIELAYPELQVEKKKVNNKCNSCNISRHHSLTIRFFSVIVIITIMLYFIFYKK